MFVEYYQRNSRVKISLLDDVFNTYGHQRDFIEKNVMCSFEALENENSYYDKFKQGDVSFYVKSESQILFEEL